MADRRGGAGKDGMVLRGINELKRFPVFSRLEIIPDSDGRARATMSREEATEHIVNGGLPGAIFARALHSEKCIETVSAWWGEECPITVQKGGGSVTFILG